MHSWRILNLFIRSDEAVSDPKLFTSYNPSLLFSNLSLCLFRLFIITFSRDFFFSLPLNLMALSLLSYDVSDLCLGKPPLRCLSASSSSVSDAITALKSSEDTFLSVWNCNHDDDDVTECECLGKISMADVICHLSKDHDHTLSVLNSSVSVLLPKTRSLVLHVQPSCRFYIRSISLSHSVLISHIQTWAYIKIQFFLFFLCFHALFFTV